MKCGKCDIAKEPDGYIWCVACREKHATYMRQYMRKHPEKNRGNVRRWRDKNPDQRRRQTHKYKLEMRRVRPLRYEYELIKKRARKIGLREILSYAEYERLVVLPCFYCGAEPLDRGRGARNGLDRTDNERGYTSDNVVPCCVACNFAKGTLSVEEFKGLVVRIVRHLGLVK